MDISAIITAAGANTRMREDLEKLGLPIINKLVLPLENRTVIEYTINNILNAAVDECIIVVGNYSNEILEVISKINDDRIKIIENESHDVPLSVSLLNGINNSKNNIILATAADQPTVTTETYQNLIKIIKNNPSKRILSILRREETGQVKTAKGLGMPFATHKKTITPYLKNKKSNINPILHEIIKNTTFYAIKEQNRLELININHYTDYQYIKTNFI